MYSKSSFCIFCLLSLVSLQVEGAQIQLTYFPTNPLLEWKYKATDRIITKVDVSDSIIETVSGIKAISGSLVSRQIAFDSVGKTI